MEEELREGVSTLEGLMSCLVVLELCTDEGEVWGEEMVLWNGGVDV